MIKKNILAFGNMPLAKAFLASSILFSIIFFYVVSWQHSSNIPWLDDIENIPFFLNQYLSSPSLYGRLESFLRPNNEHRVVSARLIVFFYYLLTSEIDYRVLLFIGNLTVFGIFLLLARFHYKNKGQVGFLAPVAFLIFNLSFHSMTQMTIMSMQYQLVIFEVFLAFYLLVKPQKIFFFGACLVAILATFSMGNGMMVWPVGGVMLALQTRWRSFGSWLIIAILAITGYFWGYNFVQGNDGGFRYFLTHSIDVIIGFFVFIGGTIDWFPYISFNKRMILPGLVGLIVMSFCLFWLVGFIAIAQNGNTAFMKSVALFYKKIDYFKSLNTSKAVFWLGCYLFIIISSAMVVFFRTRFNYWLILWPTYKIYPASFLSISFFLFSQLIPNQYHTKFLFFCSLVAATTWGLSYINFSPEMIQTKKQRMAYCFDQKRNQIGLGASRGSSFAPFIVNTLKESSKRHIYTFPNPIIHIDEKKIEALLRDTTKSLPTIKVEINKQEYDTQVINNNFEFLDTDSDGVYVLAWTDKRFYMFNGKPNKLNWGKARGFSAPCQTGFMELGTYNMGFWVVQNNKTHLYRVDKKLVVD